MKFTGFVCYDGSKKTKRVLVCASIGPNWFKNVNATFGQLSVTFKYNRNREQVFVSCSFFLSIHICVTQLHEKQDFTIVVALNK